MAHALGGGYDENIIARKHNQAIIPVMHKYCLLNTANSDLCQLAGHLGQCCLQTPPEGLRRPVLLVLLAISGFLLFTNLC